MADQYHVVLDDLAAASAAFRRGSDAYGVAVPIGLDLLTVDSGDDAFDEAADSMGDIVSTFRVRIMHALDETADKLMVAHDRYQEVENTTVRHLYDQMEKLDAIEQRH